MGASRAYSQGKREYLPKQNVLNLSILIRTATLKIIKIRGTFGAFSMALDEAGGDERLSYACVISDATACCVEGIKFVLAQSRAYPEDFPELGAEITVVGRFQSLEENGVTWF